MSDLQCPATVLLARHGEPEYEHRHWSDDGGSLTRVGRAQARALAERVRSDNPAHVWCSTLAKAVQTAEIAAAALGVGVTTREGLREFVPGDFTGTPTATDPFGPWISRWFEGDLSARIPGGESGTELTERFAGVLSEIADLHRGESVLVVSHGGAISTAVRALCRVQAAPARLDYTSVVTLALDSDAWVATAWDHTGESHS